MAGKSKIIIRALKPTEFPIIEKLFGRKGACGGCWCMYWRVPSTGSYWVEHKGAKNKRSFKKLVEEGNAKGCVAIADGEAVGWCSIGPKTDFDYLKRSRTIPLDETLGAWALTCFFISREWRRRGLSIRLINGACNFAAQNGALYLDAYPVRLKNSDSVPDAFAHTGLPGPFLRAGFEHVMDAGARQILRRRLSKCRA